MPDQTPILALPVLVPNQAQPYVTHNEALRRLDILVQLSVLEFGAETPPALPEEGDLYALGAAPVAGWAGQAHKLAAWIDGAWLFVAPQPGWRAWDRDTGVLRTWDGAGWVRPPADLDNVAGLGIGTASDPVNRLAVKSDAVLFSHDGAGHQLKINKASDADTASLLLQSNWTGHAEIGLAGDTDLVLKVSPDGSAWTEALRFDAASGEAFGAALQSGPADTSAGRIPKMGNDADYADLTADTIGLTNTDNTTDFVTLTGSRNIGDSEVGILFQDRDAGSGASDAGRINTERQNTANSFDMVFSTTLGGTMSEAVRIDSLGNLGIGQPGPFAKLDLTTSEGAIPAARLRATSAAYTSTAVQVLVDTAAAGTFNFFTGISSGNDTEFKLAGNGNGICDGSWTGGGADYAEYFEWFDGNPGSGDRRGVSVVLEGDKIRPAQPGEEPFGVISANPSVVGDGDIGRWKGKYLRDDFGAYIWEDYEMVEWIEIAEGASSYEHFDEHSYAADAVPEGVIVPEDATRTTQLRRKLNPAYDPDMTYTPRAERPEWDTVGLMGKLRLRKGQQIGTRWIKMRDVSEEIEEWLVR